MPSRGFYREAFDYSKKKIFRYFNGAEHSISCVIDSSTVTADSDGNKILKEGSLLVKITASGAYGPYASGAADGRQTLGIAPNCVILSGDLDVTRGDEALGGWHSQCDFESSQLTLFGATLANVKIAFPQSRFF